MEEFYYNTITFLSELDPLIKGLLVALLFILVIFSVRGIIKSHVNPKKPIFKFGQFLLLGVLLAITIFVAVNVF